ncbi:hypothetical protein ACFYW8_05845 [Streptomyces sp. NPDC002742]|uniref:hypothetical protein n=1 Tax=Streptomyces sp. NPDC002742 TaxID=3364663 RepID=UPI00368F2D82
MTTYMPERFDDIPDLTYNAQPVNMAHVAYERTRIDELEKELSQKNDPTYRAAFEAPALPPRYTEHETDDTAVKALGKDLVNRLAYVERNRSEYEVQTVDFLAMVSRRKQDEADYQSRLFQSVENGDDIPDPVDHQDLTPLHRQLNKLEGAIAVGAKVAHESRAKLDAAYQDLYASDSYRKWADKEISKRTQDAVKALELLRIALDSRASVIGKLPDAFADSDGVAFVRPVNLGRGGMDPYAEDKKEVSLSEALSKIESVTIPGDGIRKWSKAQLSDDELESYADRSAKSKAAREDTRTSEQKRQDADNERHSRYLGNGGMPK